MRPSSFNLRLWFGGTSFVVIAFMGAAFAALTAQFLTDHMLRREVEATSEFLESIVSAEQSLPLLFTGEGVETNPHLAELARHIRVIRDVLRANIYGPDRRIVWSTDSAVMGQRFSNNPELEAAFDGALVAEMGSLSGDVKDEHIALGAGTGGVFIEAYIPLRDGLGKTHGVIELYKVPTAMDALLRDARNAIWLSAAVGAVVLYLALFLVVGRGARLIHRQQADLSHMQAMAAVGQMAGVIAHSLRYPMAAIRSTAELMRYEIPEAEQPSRDIVGEIDRLDSHVRDLLNYSRIDAPGALPVDPLDVVHGVLARAESAMRRANVTPRIADTRPEAAMVLAEPGLLGQAMTSILNNAIEAMPTGGELTVALYTSGRREIGVAVTDTGKGIPLDMLETVGQPFATSKMRGLGLGLALSRRIVETFGGRLEIASPPGLGATVSLVLLRR